MMAVSESMTFRRGQSANLQADDVRLLAAVGFMAARSGLTGLAIRIFQGLSVIRPEADFPRIGMVISYLCRGDCEKALQYVAECDKQRLSINPELRALKALSLNLLGRLVEASELIDTVIDDSSYSPEIHPIAEKIITLFDSSAMQSAANPHEFTETRKSTRDKIGIRRS
jgi:hypothetical protein